MPITNIDKKELNRIYNEYLHKYGGKREDYFALLYLSKKYNKDYEAFSRNVAFGNNDYGLDGYLIDRETRNLYLYQFKWSENHNLFKESLERLVKDGIERIFGNPYQDTKMNEFLINLKNDLYENQNIIDKIYIQFIFKGDVEAAENSAGLSFLREDLENKKWMIDKYFENRKVNLIFEFVADKRISTKAPVNETHEIKFTDYVLHELSEGKEKMYVGFIPLADLESIYRALGLRFLNRNIRAGLSDDNPPNKKIRETLQSIVIKKDVHPDTFSFIHNGVTLAAEKIDIEDGKAKLKVPRLLNGAQSVKSIAKFIEDNREHPLFDRNLLKEVKVLSRIVIDSVNSDFVTNVTICNNRQNPVEPWNLRANDKIQCDLQDKFKDELAIYYSRQENAFENLTDSDLEELGIQDGRDIEIKTLAKTFLAVQGEIDKMSRLVDVFEIQKNYEDTFRESYLRSDSMKIILAYKTIQILNTPLNQLKEIAPVYIKESLGRARNLVASLLIQGMFNDPKIDQVKEWWGGSLSKEADFREYHSKIARNKIIYILKEVLKDESYQDKIQKMKYSFYRSKEMFRRSMMVAYDLYGWEKKSF